MLRAVTNALSYGNHLMVEAGTGVGKSFAYLVPAALFALQNNTRVVVSTNTINLQDQLIQRDLPNLCQALNLDFFDLVLLAPDLQCHEGQIDLHTNEGQ